jgi:peptidoglycan hydrolase-like protein with peptidoglycan-binding domain
MPLRWNPHPSSRFYNLRSYRRHGPFYGRYWGHYGRRWPWLHGPFAPPGPISSSFVAWAQSALASVFGPAVPQDGVFGPETRGFVQRFQSQQGLPATSDLDGATVAALQAAASPQPPPAEAPPPPAPPASAAPPPPQDAPPAQDVPPPPPARRHSAPSQQQSELAAGPAEAPERGLWVREGGRIVLMGA